MAWENNNNSPQHPNAKVLNSTSNDLLLGIKIFIWKVMRAKLSTRYKRRKIDMNINGELLFTNKKRRILITYLISVL